MRRGGGGGGVQEKDMIRTVVFNFASRMVPQGVTDSIFPTYINGRNAGFLESEQRAAQLAGI